MNRTLMQFKHVLGAIFFLLISVKGFSQPVAPAFSTSTVAPFTNPNLTSFVIDYNNDGVDDIVGFTTQYANTGKLWKNNGNGTFSDVSSTVTFSNYNWTGALDFDRNGLMDVYQLTGDTLRISFNTATGFTTPDANCGYYLLSNLFGTAATSIFNSIIGDYDGDGVYDILSQVVIGTSTKINAVKGQLGCVSGCSFKFPSQTASTLVSLSNATNTLFQLADIDNDFDMDLLVGRGVRYQNFTYSIYKKSATGYTLFSGSGYDVGRHSGFGMLGEFNNDGRTDIVSGAEDCCVAAGDALYVYYSNPNGTYTANNSAMLRNASEDPYYFKATIIDINLDKTQDIIWTEMSAINTSKTQVFLNDNFSTFTESSAAMNLHNGYTNGLCCPITLFTRATVLDINNDKKPDVNIAQIDELSPFSNTNNWQRINTTTNNSVKLKLIACNGLKEGWGARIRYKVGGVWYYQQHNAYSSSGYPFLYLGMGSATSIETIEVTWFGGAVTTASGVNAGEFKVMEENPNCTNDALSSFSFNSLSDTTTNCGVTATLSGPAGFASYSWNNGATTQSISATANGVYKLTVTNNSGCNAYDSTYLSLVKSDIFQNNSTICKGTTVLLSVDSSFAAQNLNGINLLPSNLKVGLKAYYPFSGNANDASGNNNNGTVTGATLTTDRFGNANSAYSFNGSSFIDLGNIAGVGYSTTQDITMSFWINEGASGTVISKYTNLDAANSNFFISKATSTAQLAGNGTNSLTANNLTDYRWANYVFIAASGSNKSFLYRNGVLVATGTLYTNATLSATKIMLGKLMGSPSNFFTGKIDDVFIYNRALTASEVSQLSNFQPKVTWSNGATTNTISVTPTVTTKYYATVTDGITSCMDSVTVTVSDIGAYNPFPAQSSTCGTTKSLEAGAGYTSYLWSTGATSQTISPTLNGNYSVTVTNAAGCSASDTVTVSLLNADIIQSNQTVCANTTLNLFIDSTFSGSVINAKSQMSTNLQTGLVAYYPFNGNATDISGNNNVLTANGVTLTTDRYGRSNSAYSFSNTQTSVTNYLKAVNPTPFAKNTYTISAWFNSRQFYPNIGGVTYNYQSIVFYSPQWYTYGPAYHLALQHANNSVLEGGNWTTTNTNQGVTSPNGSIVVNQWYHVVLSYDGTTIKMYKDGQLVGSSPGTISFANQVQFLIGGGGDGPSPGGIYGGFNGKIDDVGFWDRALTTNEVQELYNGRPSVLWSTGATTNKISVTPTVTTKYYATLTDGITTCRDSVTITVDDLSGFNPLQDTIKVCGDSTVLDAGAGYATYNWSNGATTRLITAKSSGKYYITVATAAGCSASDTSIVSIVKANIIQSDTTICRGGTIQLSVDTLVRGLLAYYPLDNNAQDLSGNNMNGTVTGATSTTDRFGQANKAYFFNGTSDFIKVNHDTRLNRLPLTVSCWFNANQQISPSGALVGKYYAGSWSGWQLTLNETGTSSKRLDPWYIRNSGNYVKNNSATPNFYTTQIIDSSWHHVAFVIDSTSGKIYLDGALQATAAWVGSAGIPANTWPMYFGYYPSGNAQPNVYYYRGKIDDIRLYDKALNNTEVQSAMSNSITNIQYLWSNGATTATIQVNPIVTTKYFVTVTDGITTCKDSVTITVNNLAGFNPLQDTVKVCGDSTVLDAGAGYATYNWSNGATTKTITAKASGKYYVTVATAAGCSASDTSIVSIVKAKILQRDTTICKGSSVTLVPASLKAGQTAVWSNGDTTSTISVTPTTTTKYLVTVSDGITNCKDSITVTVIDIGAFNPLQDTIKVCGDSTVLDAGAGYTTYNWSSGAITRTITAKASGKYIVTVANASGCSASDTSVVSIVKAKILQRDTTICKGSSLTLAIDSSFSTSITNCNISNLPANIKSGLVAYFPFCGNANDASGNNNNATVYGSALAIDRFGLPNSAYSFNQAASSNYMSIASSSSLNITGSLTLSFWFSAANSNTGYILDRDICNANPDWSIRWQGSQIIARYGIVGQDFEISSSVIPLNTWNLVTVVRNTSTSKLSLYINGVLTSSISYSAVNFSNNLTNIYIGESVCNSSSNPNFSGKLDDFYIFNRALDNSEVLQLKSAVNTASWSNGASGNTISVTPTTTTKYIIAVTDGITTCKDSITVTVSDIGAFNPLQDTIKVCGDSTVLDAGAGYTTYNWSNGATTRTITAKASGNYSVTVANASGCSASDISIVSIVKAKIIQRDTTICKGSSISLAIDSTNSGQTVCSGLQLPTGLRNGLVGYFPFCGNANDASGNGNNGSVVGANLITDRFGNPNSAYNFSGTNQYISVTASNLPTTSRSTALWYKTPDPTYRGNLLGYGGNGTCGTSYFIGGTNHRGTGKLVVTGHCSANETSVAYVPQAEQWVHLVTTSSSNGTKIYINGKLVASSSQQINTTGSKLFIGCISSWDGLFPYADGNGQMWKGAIDDVFIFNRELSESEITSLYNTSPSIAVWSTGATTPSIVVNPIVKTTYKVTVSDGITTCTDSVVVNVSSSELKVTDPAAVCSPVVVNLTAAAVTAGSATGLTYTYWRDANATQALANPDKVAVSGTYYIVGTSATGCTSSPTAVKVTVNPLPVATIVTPTQTTICDKSSITLTARGGTTYQWLLNGFTIAGALDSIYVASLPGIYVVNAISLGCTSNVSTPVNLSLIKAALPKFSNSSTCIDVPVSFFNETDTTSSGSVSWFWDFGDGQTSTLFNPVYTYKKTGSYNVKLTVTPKLCSSLPANVIKNITVDIPPVGIKYPNVLAVKNKATPLSARFIANGYSYLWMPSTGLNNGAIQKPIFNASNEQLYRVRLTSAGGCITMDTVKVSVYDSSDIFVPNAFSPNNDGKNDLLQPFLVNIATLKFFRVYNRWGQIMFQSSDSKQGWDGMYNYKPQPLETYTWIAEGIDGNGTTIFRKGQTILIR